jgi:hypothetical protein
MTKDEALKKALEFVKFCGRDVGMNDYAADKRDGIEAVLEEALAQPEPFAPDWVNYRQGKIDSARERREWVGLTDEEIRLDAHNADSGDWNDDRYQKFWHEGFKEGAQGAESMLKEKNT